MGDSFMLWLREAFICSKLNRMLAGNARWQKETPPNRWGFQHSCRTFCGFRRQAKEA